MKRNKFSLSHYKLLSCDMGKLIPVGLQEVIPGDSFQWSTSMLVRTAPLLAPIMHPVRVRLHHFFVPYRLIWEDFEDFITGGADGTSTPTVPYTGTTVQNAAIGSLSDYIGANPCTNTGSGLLTYINALPYRAYKLIWNEYYRDQDLQTAFPLVKTSGSDSTVGLEDIESVCWEKDYFTTARPDPQKGPSITIPFGDANVTRDSSAGAWKVFNAGGNTATTGGQTILANTNLYASVAGDVSLDPNGGLTAATQAAAGTIEELREAFAVQRYEEARSRYGSRYTEYLRYLGVTASDQRLQRPEYLGGGSETIQFSEVLGTGGSSGGDAIGTLKGHGIGGMKSNRFRRFFEEHGLVISLMSVVPKTIYGDGTPRLFMKRSKFDFYQKEFASLGMQEVWGREIYPASVTWSASESVFGYQDRYDEYRRAFSSVHGEFKTSLNYWHYARLFSTTPPALNADFVKAVPTTRTYASTSNDPLYVMVKHSIQARRPITASGGHSNVF